VPVDFSLLKSYPGKGHSLAAGVFSPTRGVFLFKDGIRAHAKRFGTSIREQIANTLVHERVHRATSSFIRRYTPGGRIRSFLNEADESIATFVGDIAGKFFK